MSGLLIKSMKGFGYGLMIGPVVVAAIAFVQAQRHNSRVDDVRQTRAVIRNAHVLDHSRDASSAQTISEYRLDLNWRDDNGVEKRADNVLISRRLGVRLVDGDQLIQSHVQIRYRTDKPESVQVLDQVEPPIRRRNALDEALLASGHSWPLAMIGGVMFYLAIKQDKPGQAPRRDRSLIGVRRVRD